MIKFCLMVKIFSLSQGYFRSRLLNILSLLTCLVITSALVSSCSGKAPELDKTYEPPEIKQQLPEVPTNSEPEPERESSSRLYGTVTDFIVTDFSVKDERDPSGLSGAVIAAVNNGDNTNYTTTSDSHGCFILDDISAGSYVVEVRLEKYLACRHDLIIEPGQEICMNYNLIPEIAAREPCSQASPRFREFTIDIGEVSASPRLLIKQLETNIIITTNGLGAETPYYFLYNAARYHAEGMLNPADTRENLTDAEIAANIGDLVWPQQLSHPNPPISPSQTICYIPIANPPMGKSGEPLYDFEKLASIELDYLRRVMQTYRDAGLDYPYFAVGGEFNLSAMNAGYDVNDIVSFYDSCVRIVRSFYPEAMVGITINNCYEYGDYHFPPFASKEVLHRFLEEGTYITNSDFITRLNDISCPYDFVATEVHLGESDPYSFEFLKYMCDELTSVGKRLYFWEFWIVSESVDDYPEGHFDMVGKYILPPEGKAGINEENQSMILSQFLDYVAATPEILGFQCDAQSRDGEHVPGRMVPVPVDYGYERRDGTLKPAYYTHAAWINSTLYCQDIDIYGQESFTFKAIPGLYDIYYYDKYGKAQKVRFILDEKNTTFKLVSKK